MKRTDGEMHYKGVSDTQSHTARTKPDPLGPLVERYLLSGDEEAMDRLVEVTRPKLMGVARRIGEPQDAEDAVQGAYMALLRKRGSGLDAPVMPWLLTTVIRLAYRRKAKQGRQRDLAARLAQPHEDVPVRRAPAALDAALEVERELAVRSAVAALPATYRDAVVLRHLEGLTTRETATLLDVPEATLRTRLHRAAKLLRSRMAPALLAAFLFLPWCAADALRRIVPITRPLLTKTAGLYAATTIAVVVGLMWMFQTPTASSGSVAHRPATQEDDAGSGADTPQPGIVPAPKREPVEDEAPDPAADDRPARLPSAPAGHSAAADAEPGSEPLPPDDDAPAPTLPGHRPPFADIAANKVELPKPPGMVFLEGGPVTIGTPPETLATLLAGRPALIRALFAHEAPRHDTRVPAYWMGRFEVTNAQYLKFLQDHTREHTTRPGGLDSLETLAATLLGRPTVDAGRGARGSTQAWRQLYEGNRGAIWKAFSGAGRDVLVLRPDGSVDLDATALRCRREPLPAGLKLAFYAYAPPKHWPGLRPAAAQENHPVGYVSYNDAERMAEWAGMHVPTEAEWEWAARGPDGRRYPWGDAWALDDSRANWGGKITDDHLEPTTLPVDTRPSGRSWCGIHHMSGNVAEWTSSWFAPYPDSRIEPHPYMGSWVKVIRGGSAVDLETLALRPAARNFVGAGPDAPPYPENLFQFVGFRLASYRQPGRDHVAPVVRRATSGHLKPGALDRERFAAFVQRDWHPADAEVPNHVYVRGRATAVVFVPVTHILRPTGGPRMMAAWKNASALRKASGLRKKARDESPFFVLGALHLDLPLEGVDVPTGVAVKKTRGSAKAPATEPGRCAPGTYLVTLWFDRIALTTATREFVCFLPALASKIPSVEVRPRSSESLGSPTLRPSLERDEGGLDFTVLLGGRRSKDKYVVRVRAALPYAKDAFLGALARDGWLKSTDGR